MTSETAIPPQRVVAVLWDADGVIQLPPAEWLKGLGSLCAHSSRAQNFLADVFAAEKPCLAGAGDFLEALGSVLERWQIDTSAEEALRLWTDIRPDPGMLDLIARLRARGVTCALATNQHAYRAAYMSCTLGYDSCFDRLLYSCELGCAKPSAGFFGESLRRLRLRPEQALFLDDHEANVQAARDAGLGAEVLHLSEGTSRARSILEAHGIVV